MSLGRWYRGIVTAVQWVLALSAAVAFGYLYRDIQLADNTDTYTNVFILEQFSPQDFKVQVDGGAVGHITICKSYVPSDWKKGATVERMTFEQRGNCKNVNPRGPGLGYRMKRDKSGELVLANLGD